MTNDQIRATLLPILEQSDATGVLVPYAKVGYDPDAEDPATQIYYDIADAAGFDCTHQCDHRAFLFVPKPKWPAG